MMEKNNREVSVLSSYVTRKTPGDTSWFTASRFGMFIHWGLYAMPARHEWVKTRERIPEEKYDKYFKYFDPDLYDPRDWARRAKAAGMKYAVLTTKHHEGFCMFDSQYTDYKCTNTPAGRDLVREYVDAFRAEGLHVGFYYSLIDWHHPSFPIDHLHPRRDDANARELNEGRDMHVYAEYMRNQVRELLTNYGPIYTLFWDIPPRYEDPSLNALARRLQPGILINDRGYDAGDFSTPERSVPEGSRFERMTEACDSVGEQSWGYRENEDYHTPRYLMSAIDKIMAMGGSYLLNVGPMADGRIPDEAARIVRRVGDWYTRMNGALEDTLPDPFDYQIPANPVIALTKAGKTYLHFYKGLTSTAVTLRACPKIPRAVRLLNNAQFLPFEETALPNHFDQHGRALGPVLHIHHIPAESLDSEPLVLEIEWE